MGNEYTKKQIRDFLESAIRKAQNPDPKEKIKKQIKRIRREKKVNIVKKYGF